MSGVAGWYYGHYVYRALNVLCKFVLFQDSCEYSCHVFCHAADRTGKYGKSCIMAIIYISCFVAEFNRIRATGKPTVQGCLIMLLMINILLGILVVFRMKTVDFVVSKEE